MKIKTFVQNTNDIDECVNDWLDKHQNLRITTCHINSQWIVTDKDYFSVTKSCMATIIIEYEE